MATPAPPGYRTTTIALPPEMAEHVDAQARRYGISRRGFIRLLLTQDMEAKAQASAAHA